MTKLKMLHPGLQRWIAGHGWNGLRPVQDAAIEPLLSGTSCVIEAPTSGGKTEAVLFPTLTRAARRGVTSSVQVLYLAPLRALLNDLECRGKDYAECCGLQAFKWHGDVSQSEKIAALDYPPNLLFTTPESLEAIFLRKPSWRKFFSEIESIVVDEAHNFAGSDRGGHLLALLERLEKGVGHGFQRIALSATIGNPADMCQWLVGVRAPALRISAMDERKSADVLIRYFNGNSGEVDEPESNRLVGMLTKELLGRRSLVFVGSRSKAEEFARRISRESKNRLNIRTHHSSVSKFYREEAESLIRVSGEHGVDAIVSTSTLELGIDIGELDCVVQIDGLASPSAFLQRIGRTGRRIRSSMYFRGMTDSEDNFLLLTATASLGLEGRPESIRLRRKEFHLLAHQMLCLSLQEGGVMKRYAWDILKQAYIFSEISWDAFILLVEHMCDKDFLRDSDGVLVVGEAGEKHFLSAGWKKLFATFNVAPMYDVYKDQTHVGTLDSSFIESLEVPFLFGLGGRLWRAERVDFPRHVVYASASSEGIAPRWDSFGGMDVPFETAQRVGEIVHGLYALPQIVDSQGMEVLDSIRFANRKGWSPGSLELDVFPDGRASIRTYAGDAVNRTFAKLLNACGLVASSSYICVNVKKGSVEPEAMLDFIKRIGQRLCDGGDCGDSIDQLLLSGQRPYLFSPFAKMLPDELIKSVLLDSSMDLDRLRSLVCGWLSDSKVGQAGNQN